MEVPVPTICENHKRVTGTIVGTVAPLIVAAVAVDQDTVGRVVSMVSQGSYIFFMAKNISKTSLFCDFCGTTVPGSKFLRTFENLRSQRLQVWFSRYQACLTI